MDKWDRLSSGTIFEPDRLRRADAHVFRALAATASFFRRANLVTLTLLSGLASIGFAALAQLLGGDYFLLVLAIATLLSGPFFWVLKTLDPQPDPLETIRQADEPTQLVIDQDPRPFTPSDERKFFKVYLQNNEFYDPETDGNAMTRFFRRTKQRLGNRLKH